MKQLSVRRPGPPVLTPPRGTISPERAALLENRGPLKILDIGCGSARSREFLVAQGHCYFGLDLSERANCDLRADAHTLPFEHGCFDAVLLVSVLQYTLDPQSMLREAHRVIKPSGTITGGAAFLEPGVWGGLVQLSPLGVATMLERTGFRLDYMWPAWSVIEAIALARQHRASETQTDGAKELGRLATLKSFRASLDFSGAIGFHAVKVSQQN